MTQDLFAGIEAGGTKILCAVATADGAMLAQERIATGEPDRTFGEMAAFFSQARAAHGPVRAGGVASFGPLDLDRGSGTYGRIVATPKPGWSSVDMRGRIAAMLGAPTAIETDVNCAALAELKYGAGRGLARLCYVTIGTGIGMGWVADGRIVEGSGHPEAGHIRVPRAPDDGLFAGICPYHRDCLEGLACGPAMQARWQQGAEQLPDGHPGWDMEAHYVAGLCVSLTYLLRPQRIVLGGGVMERAGLLARVRARFVAAAAGYALDRWSADPEHYLAAPGCSAVSPGLIGAIELARSAARGD